ncbi:MAG: hypothetical protein RL660_435 [Bacteroidota bacterium]|jgi:hypothetical protein
MANPVTYNLGNLLQQAFGVTGFFVGTSFAASEQRPVTITQASYTNLVFDNPPLRRKSESGAPILQAVSLGLPIPGAPITWQEIRNGSPYTGSVQGMHLPGTTLIDFSQAKVIHKTSVAGRNGTIKEYIGLDDWTVRIRGIFINWQSDDAPEDEIAKLIALKDAPCSIPIINDMAQWLGISDVVIENIDFPALEGYGNMQPFSIDCVSDTAFEIKYKQGL